MIRRLGGPGMHGVGGMPLSSMAGGALGTYMGKVLSTGPIAYWPLWETAGVTAQCLVNSAQNGTYTGVTLASAIAPGGTPSPFFDGANDYVNVLTAALIAAWNGTTGSAMCWAQVNAAAVWADGTTRQIERFAVDANNYEYMRKSNAANQLDWRFVGGGAGNLITGVANATDWFCVTHTWSAATSLAYYNGSVVAAPDARAAWAGNLTAAFIGSSTAAPANPWHGWLAHCAVWNRQLTPTEVMNLAMV